MARPKKYNAEYYTHDADMRNDVKIKALRRKFSHTGYAVWNYLLETLTDADFFAIDFNDLTIELLAADYDITPEQLIEITDYCVKIGLFVKQDEKLFSSVHQERLKSVIDFRQKQRDNGKKGGNPNFQSGKSNPYYKVEETLPKDNPEITDPNNKAEETLPKDNPIVKKRRVKKSKEEKIIYPYQDIVELWNSTCGNLPKVLKLSKSRKDKIKTRLTEFGEPEDWMSTFNTILAKITSSQFLKGQNKNNWQITFDWIFENSTNWVKIIEGNFDDKQQTKQQQDEQPYSF